MASAAPALITAPAITGSLAQGSTLTFDVGVWDGATSFEIEVVQATPTATLLARQAVDGETSGAVETDIGGVLTLRVWATNPSGTTYAESDPFGPIEAAGDVWVGGFVLSADEAHNPTPTGFSNNYTLLAPNPDGNLYAAPPGYGWTVSSDTLFSNITRGDVRLKARFGTNAENGIRVDLPEPGVYVVYIGVGSSHTTVTGKFAIRDGGSSAAALLHQVLTGSVNSTSTMDANGIITSSVDWTAASQYGGTPVEVTATGTSIWIGRPAESGASNLNCVTILKKAV
jgi:hypothetical protein